jgi:hypothetical protein
MVRIFCLVGRDSVEPPIGVACQETETPRLFGRAAAGVIEIEGSR